MPEKMPRLALGAATIAAGLMASGTPAAACSVGLDYRVPNTLELVKRADAIVIAEVIGEEPGDDLCQRSRTPHCRLGRRLP